MCVMISNYLDKKSMYIGLYKTPNKVLSCLVLLRDTVINVGNVNCVKTSSEHFCPAGVYTF